MKCNAGWYELNISAPDNQVSACCYYSGPKDKWADEYHDLDSYWNGANFQTLRRANIRGIAGTGCESCYFFQNKSTETQYFTNLPYIDENASPLQQANWKLAFQEFEANREILTAKPLRYYVNFGFACNLSCIQCHQVPRRKTNGRQVSSEVLYKWREHFKSALEVAVIGGEPFTLVEALKFIRAFVEDDELKDVRLRICTNGTLLHRHMETLVKKRKLSLTVSLDSMGDAYDYIRVDGKWDEVDKNIQEFLETGKRLNLDWDVRTKSALMKTSIPKLPEFAEWSGRHNIPSLFFELISAPGIEKAVADENVVSNPWLVRQIPGWKDHFTQAANIYRRYNMTDLAGSLEYFRDLIEKRLQALEAAENSDKWVPFFEHNAQQLANVSACLYGDASQQPLIWHKAGWLRNRHLVFRPTDAKDHLATNFADLPAGRGPMRVRMTWWWPTGIKESERCLVNFQDQNFTAYWNSTARWDSDFERSLDDRVVQRHLVLTEKSRQFRLTFSLPPVTMKPVVLPMRVKIEYYNEEHIPGSRGHVDYSQQELVQINAAS